MFKSSTIVNGLMAMGTGALLMTTLATTPAPVLDNADCVLTFEPHMVVAGSEALEIQFEASQEIETPDALTFQEESGLTGSLIEERPTHLLVDPTEGEAGEWMVTLHHAEVPVCTGTIHVTEAL
ncbi:MAG: hypothetical protein EA350_09615 [Gemmatimonadales bacterium]|nr:MAG: hypothetical protein EA350_09615 [Gemmatimonadales bacterium]